MNSSGIKRGLAATAISALAVTGLPALATTASANPGDVMQVGSVGPTLNGGTHGGVIVLKTKNIDNAEFANLTVFNTALTDNDADSPAQDVDLVDVGTLIPNGAAGDSNKTDGFDELTVRVTVTTPADGSTANYALVLDDDASGTVQASEARTQVSQTTSGAVADIVVSPTSQTAAQNIESAAYTVTLEDSAGRTTQLDGGDTVDINPDATVTTSPIALDTVDLEDGTDTFTATGTTVGTYDIDLDHSVSAVTETVTFKVTKAAGVTADEVDIVTGADSWDGFDGGSIPGTTLVRVDQSTIRIDFKGNDANSTVTLNLDGGNGATPVTFGGKETTTLSTVLDGNGVGSITITPDAGTIQEGDLIEITGSMIQDLEFERASADEVKPEADRYFSALKGSVDITVTVVDQFGAPVNGGFVEAYRDGTEHDDSATPQRKQVGSDGKVTFTFTDTKADAGDSDTVEFEYFPDGFATSSTATGDTEIKYTVDGQGSDFKTLLEGDDTEAADYKASDVAIVPLADTVVGAGDPEDEAADLDVNNTEAGANMTVSVDNGALILEPGEDELSEGSSSVTALASDFNAASGYRIIGTKSGVVTVTIASANRTETAQLTVLPETDTTTARNVSVSGPAEVESGTTQITYTAVVTDAFGNPVVGVPVSQLNVQVSGPAVFQDSDAQTDQNGQINLNVRVDSDAEGDVTIRVQGIGSQFGAQEDRLTAASASDDGEDLSASSNIATATTMVKAAEGPEVINAALTLKGKNNKGRDDRLFANAINKTEGAQVTLFRKNRAGNWVAIETGIMNEKGNHRFRVADLNGKKKTRYKAVVEATDETRRGNGKKKVR